MNKVEGISFSKLTKRDKERYFKNAQSTWLVDKKNPHWQTVGNPKYLSIRHAMVYRYGEAIYDTGELIWPSAVYVLPMRFTPENKAEFYLIKKHPPFSGRSEGEWMMPGGYCEAGEASHDAAKRELDEETPYQSESLVYIGSIAPLISHSRSRFPTYLAFVPFDQTRSKSRSDGQEVIDDEMGGWFTFFKASQLTLTDATVQAVLFRASTVLPTSALDLPE